MSAKLITAHGGNKNFVNAQKGESLSLGGIITQTTKGTPRDVHMRGLDRLISKTTGTPREKPIMEGVLESTIPEHMRVVPELHSVPKSEVGKTQPKRTGQVAYSGSKY